jgi:hypothetical protein
VVGASIAVAVVVSRSNGDDGINQSGSAPVVTLPPVAAGSPIQPDVSAIEPTSAAPTPADAVSRYIDAEIEANLLASYGQLSADDRAAFGYEDWEQGQDERPPYVSFTILTASDETVVVDAQLTPAINEVVGVIPGRAEVTFEVISEDGGYRVSLDNMVMQPKFPDRSLAAPVAQSWLTASQGCRADERLALEYDGSLLGTLGLVESLCGIAGTAQTPRTGAYDELTDPSILLSAFGGDAPDWTQVATFTGLTGLEKLQVILAPLGDQWVVVGGLAVP